MTNIPKIYSWSDFFNHDVSSAPLSPSSSSSSGGRDQNSCQSCPAGFFCPEKGLAAPKKGCLAGSFCPKGSQSSSPATCPQGAYCPANSPSPVPCPQGFYCPKQNASSFDKKCTNGFFCREGATKPNPTDLPEGFACPLGYFCSRELNLGAPVPCPEGTFATTGKGTDVGVCQPCAPGQFCAGVARQRPSQCVEGYLCRNASKVRWELRK